MNELDGKTWTRYSISVWSISKTSGERKLKHPAMFPLELCRRLIRIYTKPGGLVLDPFAGSGSTIVAATELQRDGIGVEYLDKFVSLSRSRLSQTGLESRGKGIVHQGDSRELDKFIGPNTVDFVLTSPPYWAILQRKRTADYKEKRPYSELAGDLGNIESYDEFMGQLEIIFGKVKVAMKPGAYCAIVVMDLRQGSKFIPFHISIVDMMTRLGFVLEDIIIWNRQGEYNNLRPLGYPYKFIVNKVHEYILIFRKNHTIEENNAVGEIESIA